MQITQEALDLIKSHEGLRLEAYKDPIGVWTIGYGTTSRAGIGVTVSPGMTITEAEAEDYLRRALELFGQKIAPGFKRPPTPNQYGAMLSLAYNIGPGAFLRSTCLKRFNAGDLEGAAEALQWFNKAGGKVWRGLVRRRAEEAELFLSSSTSPIPTPRPDGVRNSPLQSTELQAGAGQIATAVGGGVAGVAALEGTAQIVAIVVAGVVAVLALYMMRRRLARWAG
jgi:lysozyme